MNDFPELATEPAYTLSTELLNLLSIMSDIESFLGVATEGGSCGPDKVKPTLLSAKVELVQHLTDQANRIRKELTTKL